MAISLNFKVRCFTNLNERVHIVGDVDELGAWKPLQGLSLSTSSDIYPFWIGQIDLPLQPYSLIHFKVVIIGHDYVIWEFIDNHVIELCYQYQNILLTQNIWPCKIIRIASFFDLSQEEESQIFSEKKVQVLRKRSNFKINPLEDDQSSSDDNSVQIQTSFKQSFSGSDFDSLFQSASRPNSCRSLESFDFSEFKTIPTKTIAIQN